MVKDIEVLKLISEYESIKVSIKAEPTGNGAQVSHYVAFMRDLTKADRNPNRWVYGIRLDGDKLSDRFKIDPYSYAGSNPNKIKNTFRVKSVCLYDDGSCTLSMINWRTIEISRAVFDELVELIESDSQGINKIKKLQVSEGKRPYLGRKIVVKYNYNVPSGGLVLNPNTVSSSLWSYLIKHSPINETEERIWTFNAGTRYISVKGCITGYIEPQGDSSIETAIEDGELVNRPVTKY